MKDQVTPPSPFLSCMIGSALLLAVPPCTALAAAEPADQESIVVTGARVSPEEARKQATEFVRQMGVAAGEKPLARWTDAVCPRAYGIADTYAAIVEAKIRKVAMQAGARVAKAPCKANIGITFSEDARDLVRRMTDKAPNRFHKASPRMIADLRNGTDPVRWWYGTEMRDRDGAPAAAMTPPWSGGDSPSGGSAIPMDGDTTVLNTYSKSLVSTHFTRALTAVTVVIDVKRAEGLPLDAVLSYAALVALAEVDPLKPPPEGSILALFEPESTVRALTQRDDVFLRALYQLPMDRASRQQRRKLVNALIEANPGAPVQQP